MPGLTAAVMFWVFSEEVRTLDTYESACAQVIPACANATDQITLLPPGFLCQAQRDGKGERDAQASVSQRWRKDFPCTALQGFNLQTTVLSSF